MSDLVSVLGARTAGTPAECSLLADLQAGSEIAFALLIAQHSRGVYSLIARSLRDPADAADVTQDVFIKVFRNIATFHGESTLRTWIYRIALHEASNQRRWWSRHKRQELTIDAPLEDEDGHATCLADLLTATTDSPYRSAEQTQLKTHVARALQQLPPAFRDVVLLREIEGFGYDEIAQVLQINPGTVKSRLTRGRTALRQILGVALQQQAATGRPVPPPRHQTAVSR